MQKDYYMHQRFILDCDYENEDITPASISPQTYIQDFTEEPNLFDIDCPIIRKVRFSYLLKEIDNEEDLQCFFKRISFVEKLFLELDEPESDNLIIRSYQTALIKAFVHILRNKRNYP